MSQDGISPIDEQFLRRAIRLAMNGRGHVEPNPMVGCVLVKNGRVIGEGIHAKFGGPHAEPTALASCTESPEGATAYVTLEPCCHTNKKTPPCAPRLIKEKIARVVIGCLDPNPDVNGKGVAMLLAAGIRVDGPLLERPALQLIAAFQAWVSHQRPYVTLKWAETADGKVAGPRGERLQISNEHSMRVMHRLRGCCDAITVGVNTVINDDPQLISREAGFRPLVSRMILDSHARTPPSAKIFKESGWGSVDVCVAEMDSLEALQRGFAISKIADWVSLSSLPADENGRIRVTDALKNAYELFAPNVLVEPGPTLAASCFRENVADRVWVFRSPMQVQNESAPAAVPVPSNYVKTGTLNLAGDTLTEYLNPASPVYFAAEPSADLILAGFRES